MSDAESARVRRGYNVPGGVIPVGFKCVVFPPGKQSSRSRLACGRHFAWCLSSSPSLQDFKTAFEM